MGGNALKHLGPVRLSSAHAVDLIQHLHRNWQLVDPRPFYPVPWVAEKQDHGDLDLVCECEPATVLRLVALLGIDAALISRNDAVLSVPVPLPWHDGAGPAPVAQVDFICCDPVDAPATRFFYAGGDFGMLLGRIAAWHGLVFGMDGLRWRAEKGSTWQRDVPLTADPAEVLRHLGYPPALPFFATYDRLWRFVLASPMAGPWMFLPAATNAENRSRDRQRRKVGDFQAWLAEHFPDRLEPPAPRATPAQARAWVRERFPHLDLDGDLARQEAAHGRIKLVNRLLGLGAVEDALGILDPGIAGGIVRAMQEWLPPRSEREAAMADPVRWGDLIRLARAAAGAVGAARGLPVRQPPQVPPFVPPV